MGRHKTVYLLRTEIESNNKEKQNNVDDLVNNGTVNKH